MAFIITTSQQGVAVPIMVGEAARRLGTRPQHITELFYKGKLRDDICPVANGRRLIPEEYLPVIAMELRRAGKIPPISGGACQ